MAETNLRTIFVFEDLGPGLVQLEKLKKLGVKVESRVSGKVRAGVVRMLSGLVVATEGNLEIAGDIVRMELTPTASSMLEEYHGVNRAQPEAGLCKLVQTQATCSQGLSHEVEVFCLLEDRIPPSAQRVSDGNWKKAIADRPGVAQLLTPRQREYIRKLAACSGRDVVPIDLNLYRELLRLEVAVDKGRRLALTALGQEVSRWLA